MEETRATATWTRPLLLGLATVALAALALYPAILNGFPLVFSDTATYLEPWDDPEQAAFPLFYPLFIKLTSPGDAFAVTVAVQALMLSAVVLAFLRIAGGLRPATALAATGAGVLLLNQAPWLASWLMPDFMAGLGAAAIVLLVLRPGPIGPLTQVALACFALFGALVATSNIALFGCLAVVCLLLGWIALKRPPSLALTVLVIVAVTLPAAISTAANWGIRSYARTNVASAAHMFSRLSDVGLAQSYLREACPKAHYRACDDLDRLEKHTRGNQDFMWDGLADDTDAWHDPSGEYAQLSRDILLARPVDFLVEGWRDLWPLIADPTLGDPNMSALTPYGGANYFRTRLAQIHPRALDAFDHARQQQGRLLSVFPRDLFFASTFLGYAALALLGVWSFRRGDRMGGALALAGFAFIAGTLVMHAMLVGPFVRHHVKVAWISWLFAAALLSRLRQSRSESPATSGPALKSPGDRAPAPAA
jgi:hypothetical protein